MFNRGAFNRTPFNRSMSVDISFSADLGGYGVVSGILNYELELSADLGAFGNTVAEMIREFLFSADLTASGKLDAEMIREKLFNASLSGVGSVSASLSKWHIEEIEVLAPFAPGDKIVIDSAKLIVKKNGSAIGYEGEFFNLNPGGNHIVYTDTATGRTVQIRITHRDRFI